MLEANEGLENIFENAVKEAEKRRHEYVTIEHVLLSLIKDQNIETIIISYRNEKYLVDSSVSYFSNLSSHQKIFKFNNNAKIIEELTSKN